MRSLLKLGQVVQRIVHGRQNGRSVRGAHLDRETRWNACASGQVTRSPLADADPLFFVRVGEIDEQRIEQQVEAVEHRLTKLPFDQILKLRGFVTDPDAHVQAPPEIRRLIEARRAAESGSAA